MTGLPMYQAALNSPKHSSDASQLSVTRQMMTRHAPAASRSACAHFSPPRMLLWSIKTSVEPRLRNHASSEAPAASSRLEWLTNKTAMSYDPPQEYGGSWPYSRALCNTGPQLIRFRFGTT